MSSATTFAADGGILARLTLVIIHRFWTPGTDCLNGEEVFAIFLEGGGSEIQLRLSLTLRLVVDYVGKHRLAQSASQVEAGMRTDPFYVCHANNSGASRNLTRRIARSGVKTYVARIRAALQLALDEAGLRVKASDVLVAEKTVSNEVGYRLRIPVRWVHLASADTRDRLPS